MWYVQRIKKGKLFFLLSKLLGIFLFMHLITLLPLLCSASKAFPAIICMYSVFSFIVKTLSFGIFHSLTCSNNGSISCTVAAEFAVFSEDVVTSAFLKFPN